MTSETIKSSLRGFISKHIQNHQLQDDEDIFASGFVNSLFAMQLVLFIENTFNIVIEDQDLNIDNFRTINAMDNLVRGKVS